MRRLRLVLLLASLTAAPAPTQSPVQPPRLDRHGDPLPAGAVARLGSLRFQVQGNIHNAALSPDGTTLVAACSVYSPQRDERVDVLDAATGKVLRSLELDRGIRDCSLQIAPDGKSLFCGDSFGIAQYDLVSGKRLWFLKDGSWPGRFALSADGKRVALQRGERALHMAVEVCEVGTGKVLAKLPGRGAQCRGIAFSADGKRLLLVSIVPSHFSKDSMGFDETSRLALVSIDIDARKILGETTVGTSQRVALGPDGETVAVESADRTQVQVLHLPTGAQRCAVAAAGAAAAFAPDGKTLLTIDQSGRAVLWDAAKGTRIRDLEGSIANKDFRLLGFSADGKKAAVVDGGWESAGAFVVWDVATGRRAERPPGHAGGITCLAYTADGKRLVSGSRDRTVRLWDPATGEHLAVLAEHRDAVTALALAPDGKLLASASVDGAIRLTAVPSGKAVATLDGPAKGATALAFAADGKVLYAGGADSPDLIAWDIATGREAARLSTGADGHVADFAAGGALALTANGQVRDEETPERLQVWLPSRKTPVASILLRSDGAGGKVLCQVARFSPDGRLVAASQVSEYQGIRPSYGNGLLRLWERASGQKVHTLGPNVTDFLAFSPNGRLVASGGAGRPGHLNTGHGGGIDLWDALTGKKVAALEVTPWCLAFDPQGAYLATGGRDHAVVIWEVPQRKPAGPPKAPGEAEPEAWWKVLGGDAAEAYPAIARMLEAPAEAVTLLKERVRPVEAPDAAELARLLAQLDSAKFAERDKARLALEKLGEAAATALKVALGDASISLERRKRLEDLLRLSEATSPASLRLHRAVAALEWLGTADARAVLAALAHGVPDARLTIDARAALARLGAAEPQR